MLTFELTEKRFSYSAYSNSGTRRMEFKAALTAAQKWHVWEKGELKGELKHGYVSIGEGDYDETVAEVRYGKDETEATLRHDFSIYTKLPRDSFRTVLDANSEYFALYLRLDFDIAKSGMKYGPGDGEEVEWLIEFINPENVDWNLANPAKAASMSVSLVPRENPSPYVEKSEITETWQVIIATVILELKSLFWAVTVIGGLVLAKLYLWNG